jgi:hypothetical protein
MKYIIVSNNKKLIEVLVGQKNTIEKTKFIDGTVTDVVFFARDLIMQGMGLAADPLAGRNERPNPYLTLILDSGGAVESGKIADHIIRLEQMLEIYYNYKEYFERLSINQLNDYAVIDSSLTKSALGL